MIHTITARLNHPQAGAIYQDCYCYDEASIDLVAEPLVHETTECIQYALRCDPRYRNNAKPEWIQLSFGLEEPEDLHPDAVLVLLEFEKQDEDMSMYEVTVVAPKAAMTEFSMRGLFGCDATAALCPHLMDYFPEPPKHFWCQIRPTSAADQGTP